MQDKIEGYKGCPPTSDISLENLSNQITRQMITFKQNTAYELLYLFKRGEIDFINFASFLLCSKLYFLAFLSFVSSGAGVAEWFAPLTSSFAVGFDVACSCNDFDNFSGL